MNQSASNNAILLVFAAFAALKEAIESEHRYLLEVETARILGVTTRTLNKWREEKQIGYVKMSGGDIRYKWTDIDAYIEDHYHPSKAEAARLRAQRRVA